MDDQEFKEKVGEEHDENHVLIDLETQEVIQTAAGTSEFAETVKEKDLGEPCIISNTPPPIRKTKWSTVNEDQVRSDPQGGVLKCPNCSMTTSLYLLLFGRFEECIHCGLPINLRLQVHYPEGRELEDEESGLV